MATKLFATEAELVEAFCDSIHPRHWVRNPEHAPKWTAYHETAGWDLLLAHPTGIQVGIEAKLSLNAKVLEQALPGKYADRAGPDYRAVLVPFDGIQHHLSVIAFHLGITVLVLRGDRRPDGRLDHVTVNPGLPDESWPWRSGDWPNWCPTQRCRLPDYIPDVSGGKAAPVALTEWKVKAIKLLILLERRGFVTRADMRALKISESRWTDRYHGFLTPGENGGYVACGATPDLKAQHPTNWAQIEADFDEWSKGLPATGLFAA